MGIAIWTVIVLLVGMFLGGFIVWVKYAKLRTLKETLEPIITSAEQAIIVGAHEANSTVKKIVEDIKNLRR